MLESTRKKILKGDNYLKISSLRYLPRWTVFLIDIVLIYISLELTDVLLDRFGVPNIATIQELWKYGLVLGINIFFMYLFNTFSGIIRHSTYVDIQKIFLSSISTFGTLAIIKYFSFWGLEKKYFYIPSLLLYTTFSFISLIFFRIFVKQFFNFLKNIKKSFLKQRILVLGISDQSVATAKAIISNPNIPYEVVGFLTKRHDSGKARLLGRKIHTQNTLIHKTKEDLNVDGVLVIKEILSKEELNEWVNLLIEKDIKIFHAPSVEKLNEEDAENSIKNLKIEDLLNRKPIKIENDEVKKRHFGKSVLVTGGAGSIGSEIVRLVSQFEPSKVVVLDQGETPLHGISLELREAFPHVDYEFILADVSNRRRLEQIFEKYQFSMVYHAAAYKHVPIIEENPHEGVRVNIWGTKNVAELSSKYKVNRFVMVSTDKAVNPTNVMGATKRAAELFVQALQNQEGNTTKFITTRFGNVLGSNGSVIPLFQKQIEKGGPVTITHPDITRYFMTIPEACELVLQAGTMGLGGEIYVFDMGEPVKIIDLAQKMIKLYGLETGVDIQITITGLRPGEKLYEELLSDDTKTLPTHHEKIMISKDPTMDFYDINTRVNQISVAALKKDKDQVVSLLKSIVPEYKSQNSEFEFLDK